MRLSWAPAHPQYNFFSHLFYKYYIIDLRKSQIIGRRYRTRTAIPAPKAGVLAITPYPLYEGLYATPSMRVVSSQPRFTFIYTRCSNFSSSRVLPQNLSLARLPLQSKFGMLLVLFYPSVFRWTACLRRRGSPTSRRLRIEEENTTNSGNQPYSVGVRRRYSFGEPHLTICHCDDTNVTCIVVRPMAADFCLHPSEGSYWDRAILVRADAIGPKCRRQGLNLQLLSANRPVLPLELHRHKLCRKKGKQQVASRTSFFVL